MHSSALSAEHSMALADYEGCASAAACLRAARRRKQLLAKQATAGKLAKAYDRIVELEAEVAALRAAQVTTGVADMSTSSTSPVQIALGRLPLRSCKLALPLLRRSSCRASTPPGSSAAFGRTSFRHLWWPGATLQPIASTSPPRRSATCRSWH